MKEITLKFREVAVDGLPDKSMDTFVYYGYGTANVPFSTSYQCFNTRDSTPIEDAERSRAAFSDVTHWIPLDEFNAAFEDGETQ